MAVIRTGLPVQAWTAGLYDSRGNRWVFDYVAERSNIKIKPYGADSWTNQIILADNNMKPDDVTDAWLEERVTTWIDDYNNDIASGAVN